MLPANNIQVYPKVFKPIEFVSSKQYSSLSQVSLCPLNIFPANNIRIYPKVLSPLNIFPASKQYSRLSQGI